MVFNTYNKDRVILRITNCWFSNTKVWRVLFFYKLNNLQDFYGLKIMTKHQSVSSYTHSQYTLVNNGRRQEFKVFDTFFSPTSDYKI